IPHEYIDCSTHGHVIVAVLEGICSSDGTSARRLMDISLPSIHKSLQLEPPILCLVAVHEKLDEPVIRTVSVEWLIINRSGIIGGISKGSSRRMRAIVCPLSLFFSLEVEIVISLTPLSIGSVHPWSRRIVYNGDGAGIRRLF
ncbi:hypothetical protein PENTCL1PPCAC_1236, partial [Pristionchus entomophagus]